jgi:hypothetical protein
MAVEGSPEPDGFRSCPRAMPATMASTMTTAATPRFWKNFIGNDPLLWIQ